jgi:hypothetical protein
MLIRIAVLFTFLASLGCASTSPKRSLDNLSEGVDKHDVLERAGNPKRTFRSNGQDHWIYVYYENSQEVLRQLSFEDGKLVKIGPPRRKLNWNKELENLKSDSVGDGFQTIDGGSEDVNQP